MFKLTPYLLFDGTCADAMVFYQTCLGGELELTRAGVSPMKDQFPPAQRDKIIHARLRQGAIDITGSDWFHPTRTPKQGNTVCLYLTEANYEDIKAVFDKLATGADPNLLDHLREMPFGSYGALTDKFGVRWMFQGGKKSGRA